MRIPFYTFHIYINEYIYNLLFVVSLQSEIEKIYFIYNKHLNICRVTKKNVSRFIFNLLNIKCNITKFVFPRMLIYVRLKITERTKPITDY